MNGGYHNSCIQSVNILVNKLKIVFQYVNFSEYVFLTLQLLGSKMNMSYNCYNMKIAKVS
jgi:hypothetical protein